MKMRTVSQRVIMVMLLAMLGYVQGFAATYYYTKVIAQVSAAGGGKVCIGTTNALVADKSLYDLTYELVQTNTSTTSKYFYLCAIPEEGYEFSHWSTSDGGSSTSKNNPYNYRVTNARGTEDAPTTKTMYAVFAKKQSYYSKLTANGNGYGKVYVSTENAAAPAYAVTSSAIQTSEGIAAPSHGYYLYAEAEQGYGFEGWATAADGSVVSKENPYNAKVTANSNDEAAPAEATYYAKFAEAIPHYSKVTLKLNGNNDINNLGTLMLGGKVYVGRTAEEAESGKYEFTSELTLNSESVEAASHEYYLYAKADEGFEFAGFGTTASATTSFNSSNNPYKVTLSAASTDEAAPTEKTYYASFKYAADNKPSVCYANFTLVAMLATDDGSGKLVNVECAEAGMLGLNYNDDASGKGAVTTEPTWHAGSTYASEGISKPYTSGTVYFPFTIFAKANPGYEFIGWTSTSTTTNPSQKGTLVDDYSYYYSDSYTRTSVGNVNYPGSCGVEGAPKTKKYYAVFKKLEQMEEPTGETDVTFSEPTGTLELAEGSVTRNFSVDIKLSEELVYDKPGSDSNTKPNEALKQFVTVTGANGNKSEVASYSLVYESHDLGEDADGISLGTGYTCSEIRLFFPYGIKADTYTVHLPYGLYTTKAGNKTPAYEFTITVTKDENPYFTVESAFPTEGMTIKYKAATQTSEPDASKGEFEKSNITATVSFKEVVESIDESKKADITLVNTTESVNYKPTNVIRNAAMFGKVSGEVSIAYPELVNGNYTLTIPAGLFVGNGKVNEAMTVNFTVSGFKNTLKPYEMVTDQITPKANDMSQKIDRLQDIAISYKGEFGEAKALVGNASGVTIQRYTEVIQGDGEGAKPVRTYYDVTCTPSAKVQDGKLVVSFTPALTTGMYEVTVPAGLAANMEPGEMTMGQKVNAGYAETPAYSMTFNVETVAEVAVNVKAENQYGTLIVPFDATLPEGMKAYTVTGVEGTTLVMEAVSAISTNTAYVIENAKGSDLTVTLKGVQEGQSEDSYTTGLLTGVYVDTPALKDTYVMQKQAAGVGFYKVETEGVATVGANRAYLTVPTSSVKGFFFGEATAIGAIEALTSGKAEIFDLNGRKLQGLQKGMNIVNGKKIMVK